MKKYYIYRIQKLSESVVKAYGEAHGLKNICPATNCWDEIKAMCPVCEQKDIISHYELEIGEVYCEINKPVMYKVVRLIGCVESEF